MLNNLRLFIISYLLIGFLLNCSMRDFETTAPEEEEDPFVPKPIFWIPTQGPDAGEILCMALDSRDYIYAGTKKGRVYRSYNQGQTWEPIVKGLPGSPIQSLLIDDENNIFAGTHSFGLYHTHIDTTNWKTTGLNDTTVWTLTRTGDGSIVAGTENGVFYSNLYGSPWRRVKLNGDSIKVVSLATNLQNKIFAGTIGQGIFTSTDNGENWIQNSFKGGVIRLIDFNLYDHVFVGTAGWGLLFSETNGDTWTTPLDGFTQDTVAALAFNSKGSGFIAGQDSGVFVTTDNGLKWEAFNDSLTCTDVTFLLVDKQDFIFAGTKSGIIFRTSRSTKSF